MEIQIFSDVVCPWCYIGDSRLEKALAQRPGLQVEKSWQPFQLRPELPPAGEDWKEFSRSKFGGEAKARQIFAHVTDVGAGDGVHFDFEKVAIAANTTNAHRLILLAAQYGKQWETAHALFAAYFAEGRNISDNAVLTEIAGQVGLNTAQVADFLAGDVGREEVVASQDLAGELGITGVPFYIIGGKYGISGAQPVEVFLKALDMAAKAEEAEKLAQ